MDFLWKKKYSRGEGDYARKEQRNEGHLEALWKAMSYQSPAWSIIVYRKTDVQQNLTS